jgi:CubicO group peptidase (beta-lactamase class C family)
LAEPLLSALPDQPEDVAWPTSAWPEAKPGSDVDATVLERELDTLASGRSESPTGETHALAVVCGGRLVAERYGAGHGPDEPLCSWSMAKSVTHALVGILVREGRLDLRAPAPVPAWQDPTDPRRAITLDHLLRMCDGLEFTEDYVDQGVSHVIEMLFGAGKDDVRAYAEARPAAHAPGSVWSYSSGTSNVVSGILGRMLGGEPGLRAFMTAELFGPLGMQSAEPRFDAAGNFIASSFVFATARDFARFGLLYLRDGLWQGRRILPPGWVDHGRTATPASKGEYGAHWWLATDGSGIWNASGYNGQYIVIDPSRDLLVVRLGDSTPEKKGEVVRALARLIQTFPRVGGGMEEA